MLEVTGYHVKFAHFVLLFVSEEAKHDFHIFRSMYNKTIIRFGLCDIQNNQGLGKGYQLQPFALADNPCLDVGYLGYQKTLIQQLFNNVSNLLTVARAFVSHQYGTSSILAQCHKQFNFVAGSHLLVFLWVEQNPVNVTTLFWPKQKLVSNFFYSKNLFNGHPFNAAIFLWLVGDWINGVSLYSSYPSF